MQGLEGYWSKKVFGLTTLSHRLCFILLCSALLFYCTHAQLCNLWLNLCVGVSLNVFDCTCKMFYTVRCALVVELTVVLILLPLLSSLFINYGDSPGSVSDTWGRQEMCYIFFLPFTMSCLCLTFNYQPWHHVCFLLFPLFKESFYVTLTRLFRGQRRSKSELYVREEKRK